ncbi:MAG: hypothetical protein Q7R51_01740 [bacterium]|nr:hypothetical protein [bacterium]
MSVEANYFQRRPKGERLIDQISVRRGSAATLKVLDRRILAMCHLDNISGTVAINEDDADLILYESPEDEKGRKVSYKKPIDITGEQELSILFEREYREIVIFLNPEDNLVPTVASLSQEIGL